MSKLKIIAVLTVALVGAVGLVGGGVAIGYGQGLAAVPEANSSSPTPCNLRLTWDRVSRDFQAVYEDSAFVAETDEWGRTANLTCTDAQILDWQSQRRSDGQDDAICRPMLVNDAATGTVYVDGCAAPRVVVERERR